MDGKPSQKKCFKCDRLLLLDEFYKHPAMADGHVNKCKECNKKDVQENYAIKRDHYRAYDKSRLHAEHRVTARREYAKQQWETNREDILAYKRKWVSSNPERRRITLQKQRAKFPQKYKARQTLGNAVRDGKIRRQPCERCGSLRVHGHHEDYGKPLQVMWLCCAHHAERHRELRDMGVKL